LKKVYLIIFISFLFGLSFKESGKNNNGKQKEKIVKFMKTFGGRKGDVGNSVLQTKDGGFIIAGRTKSFGNGGYDGWLIKVDLNGNEEWEKTFGGNKDDRCNSIQQTMDGGFVIIGFTESIGSGGKDVWLVKTDLNGNEEWTKTFGGSSDDIGSSVQPTTDGFIIIGNTESFGSGKSDVWLIKTDSDGNEVWNKTFGGIKEDRGESVQNITDGFIIAGRTKSFGNGGYDVWLIKTDSNGKEEFNKTFGGTEDDFGKSIQNITDGFIIAGRTKSFGDNDQNVWLIKTDFDGNEVWNKTFGENIDNIGNSVQQTTDGGYIITGFTKIYKSGVDFPIFNVLLIKTDSDGDEVWNTTFGGIYIESGQSVKQTLDGGYIIIGDTWTFGKGFSDVWLIKTDSEGNTVPIGH